MENARLDTIDKQQLTPMSTRRETEGGKTRKGHEK
jgi:hypothetical protein